MFRFYPVIIIIQLFCLYHASTNKHDQKWFWIILFFPLIGGLIYLYEHVYRKPDLNNLAEGVKGAVTPNYAIKKLEKAVKYSNTIENRTRLADHYASDGRYEEAIDLYNSCLEGFNKNDTFTLIKLLEANFLNENFEEAVAVGNQINGQKVFEDREERASYAWALHKIGQSDKALKCFESMDGPFSNYPQRIAYCKFLLETDEYDKAMEIADEMREEFLRMDRRERRQKSDYQSNVEAFIKANRS